MVDLFLGAGAGCVVQILEIELESTPAGWTEAMHVEVAAVPDGPTIGSPCPALTLPLPAGASWERVRGRVKPADGRGYRIREERLETSRPHPDLSRTTTVHLPELQIGDRVVLDLRRTLPIGPARYVDASARYLRVAGDADLDAPPSLTRDPDRGSVWGRDVTGATVVATSPAHPAPTPIEPLDTAEPAIEGRITLDIPEGRDPMLSLYPGGGSQVQTSLFLTFPPSDTRQGWILPASPDDVELPRGVAIRQRRGVERLEVPPRDGPMRVGLRWTVDDAPTYGTIPADFGPGAPGAVTGWEVDAGRGVVAWDADHETWALLGIDGRPVVPDRTRFLVALANRFERLSMPEPGVPGRLRGVPPSPELAAALPRALASRAGIVDWPHDPHWPRKLRRARRSGAMPPTEAALTVWLMARQIGFDASWAFVRPSDGPDDSLPFVSPAAFDRPIVVFRGLDGADGPRFLDPSCAACGPFELPRELWGSDGLGPDLERTPAPPPGDVRVVTEADGTLEYRFSGAAALALRREVPRAAELAAHLGGPGATAEATGFLDLGGPLQVRVSGAATPFDPLRLDPDVPLVPGSRRVELPAHGLPDLDVTAGPLRLRRATRGPRTVEVLDIGAGWASAADVAVIEQARFAADPTSASDSGRDPTPE